MLMIRVDKLCLAVIQARFACIARAPSNDTEAWPRAASSAAPPGGRLGPGKANTNYNILLITPDLIIVTRTNPPATTLPVAPAVAAAAATIATLLPPAAISGARTATVNISITTTILPLA